MCDTYSSITGSAGYSQNLPLEYGSPLSSISFFSSSCDEPVLSELDNKNKSSNNISLKPYKLYSCSHCSKIFNRPSALKTHTYTHTDEKPFECSSPGCGRKFSVVSNLRRHFKLHKKSLEEEEKNSKKITAKYRIQRVPRLNRNKLYPLVARPEVQNKQVYSSIIPNYDAYNYSVSKPITHYPSYTAHNHYLLLPPILSNNNFHSATSTNTFPNAILKERESQYTTDINYTKFISPATNKVSTSVSSGNNSSFNSEHDFTYFWTNHIFNDLTSADILLSKNIQTTLDKNNQSEVLYDNSYSSLFSYF